MAKEDQTEADELTGDLLGSIHDAATFGDDWLVSLARGLGKATARTFREAAELGDAARSAGSTTREITLAVIELVRPPPPDPAADPQTARLVQELTTLLKKYESSGFDTVAERRRMWTLVERLHEVRNRLRE